MEKRKNVRLFGAFLIFLACLSFFVDPASAADYPKGPITLTIPFSQGGATDTSARAIAAVMEAQLKVPVVCENKLGGGGAVGFAWLARQKPDGYNIGITTVTLVLQQYTGISGVKVSEFEPISVIAYADNALTVPANSPFKTLKDLVAYAKKNPRKVRVANGASGGIWHLCAVALEEAARVQFSHVPFKGGMEGAVAMLGGHVEASTSALGEVAEFATAGRVRILGLPSKERISMFPDVPTFREQGFDVDMGSFFGLIAPKGTPKEIIKVLDEASKKGTEAEKYRQIQSNFGNRTWYVNPDDFAKLIKAEDARYREIAVKLGLGKIK
jgi:tripartite-type tricarboxylate transporter receptor subunit TctC